MAFSILDLSPIISGDNLGVIQYMEQKHLLSSAKQCPVCTTPMDFQTRSDISDGYRWRCPDTTCRKCVTVRENSFFEKSRLALKKWLVLIYWWARQYPVSDACEEAQVTAKTAVDVYQWLREVCATTLLQTQIMLGGPSRVVQIDESLFTHKPKVNIAK